jgi:hypothetical protein
LGGLGLSSAATDMPAAWLGSWSLTKNLVFFVRKFFIRAASSSLGTAQPSSVQLRKP